MKAPRPLPIVIAGAGIGGLTAALALAARGFAVRVIERAPELEEAGAGLQLSPNATRILARLGLLDALMETATVPRAVVLRDAMTLGCLATVPLGADAAARHGSPYLVMHRADLQDALVARVSREPAIELTTRATVRGFSAEGENVMVSFETGGAEETARGALLVGADGVGSAVRDAMGAGHDSRHSGNIAWRTMIPAASPLASFLPGDAVTAFLHPAVHLVAYPVRRGAGINLVALTRDRDGAGKLLFESAMRRLARPLADLSSGEAAWTAWPIRTVDRRGRWIGDRVALIGDAAHAMTPFAAQGAAMAIEDAAVLAVLVAATPGDPLQALRRYETLRRPRVLRVARRGALNHFTWHAAGPVALARNAILALRGPQRLAADLDWLYGFDAEAAVSRPSPAPAPDRR